MREVRFFSNRSGEEPSSCEGNHWAGTDPQSRSPFWVIRIIVDGPVDPRNGYVCDIKVLDDLVRKHAAPHLAGERGQFIDGSAHVVRSAFDMLERVMAPPLRLTSLQLRVSPYTFVTAQPGDSSMITLTQSFEFSAAHRLCCLGLTDEENRRLFGKCSNPHGHGHNYILEVSIETAPANSEEGRTHLDRVVEAEIIHRFDHKNLNVECAEFRELNPTVENIAQVIFDRLQTALSPLCLSKVRVWETAKTYAECSTSRTSYSR